MNKITYCVVESLKPVTNDTRPHSMTFHRRLTP